MEIERKFTVDAGKLNNAIVSGHKLITQYYLPRMGDIAAARVRITSDPASGNETATLTLKSVHPELVRREVNIDVTDQFSEILAMYGDNCPTPLIKHRREVMHDGRVWEIDTFYAVNDPYSGENLVLAEVELDTPDDHVNLPDWVVNEVTGDSYYYNETLFWGVQRDVASPSDSPQLEPQTESRPLVVNSPAPGDLVVGDYVFASKWHDCDPGDPWAVGHVSEVGKDFVVVGEVTKRRWPRAMRITHEQGRSIVLNFPKMEIDYHPGAYEEILSVFSPTAVPV